RRAGGEDQDVVVDSPVVAQGEPALLALDPDRFGAAENAHAGGERIEAFEHDLGRCLVGEREAVRQARTRVVAVGLGGHQRHRVAGVLPERFCHSHAGEARADDHDLHAATIWKSVFFTPQSGQLQLSGTSSQRVPGAMPAAGSPTASSYTWPQTWQVKMRNAMFI